MKVSVFLFGLIMVTTAYAVISEFDDIALDGAGSDPFIRLDTSDGGSQYIVGFINDMAFYDGNSYALRLYETGGPNSIVSRNNRVGIHTISPAEDFHVEGNALISGNLELGSSRNIKKDIAPLTSEAAMTAFSELEPVSFSYLHSPEEMSLGFIAEDVPELVATNKRTSLSSMDMVALLTRVVQEQQTTIAHLSEKVERLCGAKGC
jgi:hypothetical protein